MPGKAEQQLTNTERHTNRLAQEKSPYLLQHAHNPVDWYPWGDEAFAAAKREDKPIFLSIGYSTCHWCHVMEHESFEDPEVAKLMNDVFINIKVDREERPDVDHLYMTVCQMMTGSGGWPLTIVMTPDQKPFFAGTYIPKTARFGRSGMLELVPRLNQLWREERGKLNSSADQILGHLNEMAKDASRNDTGGEVLEQGFSQLKKSFDPKYGGFGSRMKFPTPHNLLFLLRYWKRSGDTAALEMVTKTLTEMRLGGIFDHVGFGFHRYSTDPEWLVPHFEKMLYDQALLMLAYTEGFLATKEELYAQTVREIGNYVLRMLRSKDGGFYTAEDADSEGEEGKFYVWSSKEINRTLDGGENAKLFQSVFGVKENGNFKDEASGRPTGENILHLKGTFEEDAPALGMDGDELMGLMDLQRAKLFEQREKRPHPLLDDKVLTDWNGLMIGALAFAGASLGEKRFSDAAEAAAKFVGAKLTGADGRLIHRYRDGEAKFDGQLDDYAFYIFGLIELYQATFNVAYLEQANTLQKKCNELFWDKERGGFYLTASEGEQLLVRMKETYDGAIPSGNSVALGNLLKLARLTGEHSFEELAGRHASHFGEGARRAPGNHTWYMSSLDFAIGPSKEVVIVGKAGAADTQSMLTSLRQPYVPNKVVLMRPEGSSALDTLAPFTTSQKMKGGKATAYVCVNHACSFPTFDVAKMLELVNK